MSATLASPLLSGNLRVMPLPVRDELMQFLRAGNMTVFVFYVRLTRSGQHAMCFYTVDAERRAHKLDPLLTRLWNLSKQSDERLKGIVYPDPIADDPVVDAFERLERSLNVKLRLEKL